MEPKAPDSALSLTTRVRPWRGSPTLFINDQPDTGLMLYHGKVFDASAEIAQFAHADIHLFTTDLGSTTCFGPDGSIDSEEIDRKMAAILSANPRAFVLPRVGLSPPDWWRQAHPGELMIHRDPFLGENVRGEYDSVSFASAPWRHDMAGALRQIIRHMEARWGDRILGYHLAAGECGEWSYIWRHYTQSDYSAPQLVLFRQWLRQKYRDCEDRFRHAWGLPDFEQVEIPSDWRWSEGQPAALSRPDDQPLCDYLAFHSEVVADAALHFARVTKDELRLLDREKVVAAFYGYHFTPPGQPSAFTNSGHHALHRLLVCDDIDILCAPYSYHRREAGGCYYSQLVTGSARLHGKLVYSEDDTVTHVVPHHPHRYNCPDAWTSRHVICRNILGALRDGGTAWYMDWFGANWYNDDELLASFAANQQFARRRLKWDTHSVAQVAVFASSATARRLRPLSPWIVPWALEAVADLHRLGAPLDLFLLDDLPALLGRDDSARYRLFVFLDVVDPDAAEKAAIGLAEKSGRTLLWTHPFGHAPAGPGPRSSLPLDIEHIRAVARECGVHLYSEAGDFVLAESRWLAVHAASDGPRLLHLPPGLRAVSASGEESPRPPGDFSITLRQGETRLWLLESSVGP